MHVFTSLRTCEKSSPSQIDICLVDDFKGTFNFAAEIARLVKQSTFATAKDRIFRMPFLGSRNGVNSAYSCAEAHSTLNFKGRLTSPLK